MKQEHPCFDCKQESHGKIQLSPCCHDSVIRVDTEEYRRLFLQPFQDNQVEVEELHTDAGSSFLVTLLGQCPHLTSRGLCGVQRQKPRGCAAAEPGNFRFCIR